jgi:hypothetical protein
MDVSTRQLAPDGMSEMWHGLQSDWIRRLASQRLTGSAS